MSGQLLLQNCRQGILTHTIFLMTCCVFYRVHSMTRSHDLHPKCESQNVSPMKCLIQKFSPLQCSLQAKISKNNICSTFFESNSNREMEPNADISTVLAFLEEVSFLSRAAKRVYFTLMVHGNQLVCIVLWPFLTCSSVSNKLITISG